VTPTELVAAFRLFPCADGRRELGRTLIEVRRNRRVLKPSGDAITCAQSDRIEARRPIRARRNEAEVGPSAPLAERLIGGAGVA
jgi:hypothetical protein